MEEQTGLKKKNIKEPVCVTRANGFIGSWLVRTLLDHGYTTIHASVFPGSDASHLFALPGAADPDVRLVVHEADVLDAKVVSNAVEGCADGGVFHVASQCSLEDPVDPQRELVTPAVQGTLNVLAAAKMFNVRRVVVTSSISALVPNPSWPSNTPFDESSWTDLDYVTRPRKINCVQTKSVGCPVVGNDILRGLFCTSPCEVGQLFPISLQFCKRLLKARES
ncbi:hypothetical protein F0562_020152 [Nyssa sinensis]|uniref:NAD-dependent epimerase/dehydratase domain-containing protein n=1 Tax=Nyssa sinensis TaxID=561372 RepID=A0A5J5BR85_9ASTE|nr:hypothetical protein F0562_020152 [Nyssa sinensis]